MKILPKSKTRRILSIIALIVLGLIGVESWHRGGIANLPVLREMRVKRLAGQLDHEDPWIVQAAARELGTIGPAAKDAVPALVDAIKATGYIEAAWALEKIGPDARSAIPELLRVVASGKTQNAAQTAAHALIEMGLDEEWSYVPQWPDVNSLLSRLEHRGGNTYYSRRCAFVASVVLAQFGPESASDLSEILRALDDDEPRNRRTAAWALGRMGDRSKPAGSKLLAVLRDKDPLVSLEAAEALKRVDPEALDQIVPSLIAELKEGNPDERVAAARILGSIGGAAEPALPHLKEIVAASFLARKNGRSVWAPDGGTYKFDGSSIHWRSLEAIMAIEWPLSPAILEWAMEPKEGMSNFFIVIPLGTMLQRYGFPYSKSRSAGEKWSKEVGSRFPPWFLFELRRGWPDHRAQYGEELVLLPPHLGSISTLLVKAGAPKTKETLVVIDEAVLRLRKNVSTHPNPVVRALAAAMLEGIGPPAASALPDLRKASEDTDPDVRKAAISAISRISQKSIDDS